MTPPDAPDPGDDINEIDAAMQEANPNYRCIRAYYDSNHARLLKRIGIDDLPPECETLAQALCIAPDPQATPAAVEDFLESRTIVDPMQADQCLEPSIANHNFRALLVSMHNYKVWMQSDRYAERRELDRFFEELSEGKESERFIYIDLPTHLERNEGFMTASEAKQSFRSLMQDGIEQLAESQKRMGRYALLLGGRPAADAAFGKAYPKQIVGIGIVETGFEIVYGLRIMRSPWRWDSSFRFFNLGNRNFTPTLEPFTADLYFSTQVTRILSPVKFLDFELGGGWAVSERLALSGDEAGHVVFRTGPRGYAALVLLQRIYLAVNVDYYPFRHVNPVYERTGVQVADDWNFNFAAGWRFLY